MLRPVNEIMNGTSSTSVGTNLRPRQEALLVALRFSNLAVLENAGYINKTAASSLSAVPAAKSWTGNAVTPARSRVRR